MQELQVSRLATGALGFEKGKKILENRVVKYRKTKSTQ